MDRETPQASARASWRALGTSAVLVVSEPRALAEALSIVERELDRIDWACSRFREDSELTRLNAHAGRTVRVAPLLLEATEVALRAAELTDGDVDPTVGRALELAGYVRDWGLLDHSRSSSTSPPTTVRASFRSGWQTVEINSARATLRIPAGVKLDLGATAKAWAADRASQAVYEAVGCGVLVSLGGDIATAGPAPAAGWGIHVTDDHRAGPDAPGQTISIEDGGLATSSTTVRRWRHQGESMHHIMDPTTGAPVQSVWRTVSVAAGDCADANIAATAAIIRGREAPAWLQGLGLPARLVSCEGRVHTVGDWPSADECATHAGCSAPEKPS
ncbi:MAG: FAD:protein FMN transferase [Solirubrobacteraceae bacterium]